jgi:predicted transcriptional regulator
MLSYAEEMHTENLALTLKCIIDIRKPQFKTKSLARRFGLDGHVLSKNLPNLVEVGYLRVEKGSRRPTYYIMDVAGLEAYYKEVKKRLPAEFIRDVLDEPV